MAEAYMRLAMEENPRYENAVAVPTTGPNRVSTTNFFWPIRTGRIDPGINLFGREDEIRGNLSAPATLIDSIEPTANVGLFGYMNALVPLLHLSGFVMTGIAGTGTLDVQTLTMGGGPTGGTFTLTWNTQTTAPIPYNATAAQVQAALNALTNIGPGVTVTGGPFPATPIVVTFNGSGLQAVITATNTGLTGGATPAVTVVHTTSGTTSAAVDPDGFGVPVGATMWTATKRSGPIAKSAQIDLIRPGEAFYERLQGAGVSQLTLNANGEISADFMGLVHIPITDPALTPSYDSASIVPVRRGDFTLAWLTGAALIQDWSATITNNIERGDHLGIRSYYRKRLDATGAPVRVGGNLTSRDITLAEVAASFAQSTFVSKATFRAAKGVGSTAYPYSLWVQGPSTQLRSFTTDPVTNARRFGATYEWWHAYDEGAGYDSKITVVNAIAPTGLETYV